MCGSGRHGKIIEVLSEVDRLSTIRSREMVLRYLLPQCIGLIWERARAKPEGITVDAFIGDDFELHGYETGSGHFGIGAYVLGPEHKASKVFSVHVGRFFDTSYRQKLYCDNKCVVLSWRRGSWEDRIMAEKVNPRGLQQMEQQGLIPQGPQSYLGIN